MLRTQDCSADSRNLVFVWVCAASSISGTCEAQSQLAASQHYPRLQKISKRLLTCVSSCNHSAYGKQLKISNMNQHFGWRSRTKAPGACNVNRRQAPEKPLIKCNLKLWTFDLKLKSFQTSGAPIVRSLCSSKRGWSRASYSPCRDIAFTWTSSLGFRTQPPCAMKNEAPVLLNFLKARQPVHAVSRPLLTSHLTGLGRAQKCGKIPMKPAGFNNLQGFSSQYARNIKEWD